MGIGGLRRNDKAPQTDKISQTWIYLARRFGHVVLHQSAMMNRSTDPGCEVHRSASVQQQSGDVDVAVVSSDVQRSEATLSGRERNQIRRKS